MDLRKAIRVLVTASAIDAAMAGCSWCKLTLHKGFGQKVEAPRSDVTEAPLSSIQLTTPLLCFLGKNSCQEKLMNDSVALQPKRLRATTSTPK